MAIIPDPLERIKAMLGSIGAGSYTTSTTTTGTATVGIPAGSAMLGLPSQITAIEFTDEDKKELDNLEADLHQWQKQEYLNIFKTMPVEMREDIIREGTERDLIEKWSSIKDTNFPDSVKIALLKQKRDASRYHGVSSGVTLGTLSGGSSIIWPGHVTSGYSSSFGLSTPILRYGYIYDKLNLQELRNAHADIMMEEELGKS